MKSIKPSDNFFLLAGPCVIEGERMALDIAGRIVEATSRLGIPYVFKGSYRKANRSRLDSFTGIGDLEALRILAKVREEFGVPVVTDIHSPEEADMAAEFVDVLQIRHSCAVRPICLWRRPAPAVMSTSRRASFSRPKPWSSPCRRCATPVATMLL